MASHLSAVGLSSSSLVPHPELVEGQTKPEIECYNLQDVECVDSTVECQGEGLMNPIAVVVVVAFNRI